MDCCLCWLTNEEIEGRRNSRIIEREIREDKARRCREIKVLLLGAGESGKSTFIKQMRIIHKNGFTEDEKKAYIQPVYQHMITAMQSMIKAMDLLKIDYNFPEILTSIKLISGCTTDDTNFDCLRVYALKKLWNFDGVKECYLRRSQYQLSDSTEYFFTNIDRLALPNYIPSQEDILRVRIQTTSIDEYDFTADGRFNIRMVDVGGQRSQRGKWLHYFEDVTSIIFLASLSEYDQTLLEAENVNRMEESKALFKAIIDYKWFENTSIILLLNKKDLLEKKILYSHLKDYFPQFNGQERDAIAAREFILGMFGELNETGNTIYSHYTCATDTENISFVFMAVKNTIIRKYMLQYDVL